MGQPRVQIVESLTAPPTMPGRKGKEDTRLPLDPDAKLLIKDKNGNLRGYKPTQMQLKAEYYRAQGMSKRAAMRKAGYSMKHTTTNPFSKHLAEYMNLALKEQLVKRGLTAEKVAEKMLEWIDAKKTTVTKDGDVIENPDTANQIKAYEKIDAVMGFSSPDTPKGMISGRKMTIEEFTFGDTEADAS